MPSNYNEVVVGVVLAGGEGRRLRPLSYYFQKCMIPIGCHQKPLLEYILFHLRRHGIFNVKLLVGYKHEQIENYFNDGSSFGVRIEYFIDDPSFGGSGGALLNAVARNAFLDTDVLLVYYGDILSNIDLSEMVRQHVESGSVATLALTNGFEVPVGVADVKGRDVIGWVEKPRINIYAGIGVVALSTAALGALKELAVGMKKLDLMGDLIPFLIGRGEMVQAYITDAFWYDVGSLEKYEKIDNDTIDKLFNP
ncbi:MAG: nucleotidyltransferase family protein [Candidatus Hodarchaeota archaeon]